MEEIKETKEVKEIPKKQRILLITIGIILIVAIIVTSLTVAILQKQKEAPQVSVEVLAQPDNKIVVSWNKKNTKNYLVEFYFSLDQKIEEEKIKKEKGSASLSEEERNTAYKNSIKTLSTNETKIELDRKRGTFKVRVKGVSEKSKNDTAFSEWQTKEISAYKLDKPQFKLEKEGEKIVIKNFISPTYAINSTESGKIIFFEYKDSINDSIEIFSKVQINIAEWTIPSLPEDINQLTVYIRAVNFEQTYDGSTKNIDTAIYRLYESSDFAEYSIDII